MPANLDIRGAEELQRLLSAYPRAILRASRRTVDKTATKVRKESITRIVRSTTATRKAINQRIKVTRRSRQNDVRAIVGASTVPIPITEFKPKVRARRTEVRADISTKPGVAVEVIRKAFKPVGLSKKNIFERVVRGGRRVSRLPIRRAVGPGAGLMLGPLLPDIISDGERSARVLFLAELQKEERRISNA